MRTYQDDAAAREFAEARLGYGFAEPMIGVVVEDAGRVVGAVIFNGYTPGRNIDMTGVGKFDLRSVRDLARYCFSRVARVTARTTATNSAAIKALQALGFEREGIMPDYFPDGAAIVFGLLKRNQKIVKVP